MGGSLLIALSATIRVDAEDILAKAPSESSLGLGQPVRPALKAEQYIDIIDKTLGPAMASLRQLASQGRYSDLLLSLVLSPFDDLRQATYFLPWVRHSCV